MRRFFLSLTALVPVVLLSACGGNNAATGSLPGQPQAQQHYTVASLSHDTHRHHTPARPPKPRHHITAADRARARAGGWTALTGVPNFPNGAGQEIMMTDGTIMVADNCSALWYSYAPDINGNYANGTWTQKAAPSYAPLYFASAVLTDGKLIINGGEYDQCVGKETTKGAIYDPIANTWADVSPPSGWGQIGDAQSVILNDGTYMIGNCCTSAQAQYDESTGAWTAVGTGKHDSNSEEGWTLLANGTVLAADVLGEPNSEAYDPSTNMWSSTGSVGNNLTSGAEIGPQTLLPNGKVWVAGGNGLSAVYNSKTKSWKQGPSFPVVGSQQLDVADGPSTVLTDGSVIIPASPGLYNSPATYFIYKNNKLKQIAGPPNAPNDSSFNIRTLMLPTGEVLVTDFSNDVEIYTANRRVDKKIAPQISSVPSTVKHGKSYTVTGTKLNGFTQENFYGDDAQQATNFPLVRITNNATGHVFYARTHGFTFMGVAAPTQSVSATFDVPSNIETGASTLEVVTNGIASKPQSITVN